MMEDCIADAPELFGVSQEKADEAQQIMLDATKGNKSMVAVAEALDIQLGGMNAFKAYIFGRLVEQNDQRFRAEMKLQLMKKLKSAVGEDMFKKAFDQAFSDFKKQGGFE